VSPLKGVKEARAAPVVDGAADVATCRPRKPMV
jgi:hypothetical protein